MVAAVVVEAPGQRQPEGGGVRGDMDIDAVGDGGRAGPAVIGGEIRAQIGGGGVDMGHLDGHRGVARRGYGVGIEADAGDRARAGDVAGPDQHLGAAGPAGGDVVAVVAGFVGGRNPVVAALEVELGVVEDGPGRAGEGAGVVAEALGLQDRRLFGAGRPPGEFHEQVVHAVVFEGGVQRHLEERARRHGNRAVDDGLHGADGVAGVGALVGHQVGHAGGDVGHLDGDVRAVGTRHRPDLVPQGQRGDPPGAVDVRRPVQELGRGHGPRGVVEQAGVGPSARAGQDDRLGEGARGQAGPPAIAAAPAASAAAPGYPEQGGESQRRRQMPSEPQVVLDRHDPPPHSSLDADGECRREPSLRD